MLALLQSLPAPLLAAAAAPDGDNDTLQQQQQSSATRVFLIESCQHAPGGQGAEQQCNARFLLGDLAAVQVHSSGRYHRGSMTFTFTDSSHDQCSAAHWLQSEPALQERLLLQMAAAAEHSRVLCNRRDPLVALAGVQENRADSSFCGAGLWIRLSTAGKAHRSSFVVMPAGTPPSPSRLPGGCCAGPCCQVVDVLSGSAVPQLDTAAGGGGPPAAG